MARRKTKRDNERKKEGAKDSNAEWRIEVEKVVFEKKNCV